MYSAAPWISDTWLNVFSAGWHACLLARWLTDCIACWWLPGLLGHLRCLNDEYRSGCEAARWLGLQTPLHVYVMEGGDMKLQRASVLLRSKAQSSMQQSTVQHRKTHNIPIHRKQRSWIIMFRDFLCRSKQAGTNLYTFIRCNMLMHVSCLKTVKWSAA